MIVGGLQKSLDALRLVRARVRAQRELRNSTAIRQDAAMPTPSVRPEFTVHLLNAKGITAATQCAEIFSDCLNRISELIPVGRELSIAITKLQEAAFFVKRGIASLPEHQQPLQPPMKEIE